jgi:hypothetical protein
MRTPGAVAIIALFWGISMGQTGGNVDRERTVRALLDGNPGLAAAEALAYANQCETAAKRFQDLPIELKKELYKKIGDIYYDRGFFSHADRWSSWYGKVVALDPAMEKASPIGYRLQQYKKISTRRTLMTLVFVGYAAVVLLLALRLKADFRSFKAQNFFRSIARYAVVFLAGSAIVFLVDAVFFHRSGAVFINDSAECGCSDDTATKAFMKPVPAFTRPTVPLSFCDGSNPRRMATIFLLGFTPIALALLYRSFSSPGSFAARSALVMISILSLWTHFFLTTALAPLLTPKVAVTGSRIIYKGELRKMLLDTPEKVLRANPNVFNTRNSDIGKFMKKHYPDGIPEKGKK